MNQTLERKGAKILGAHIDALSWDEVIARLTYWIDAWESKYVCICNVQMAVIARRSPEFSRALNGADMATPDGMPIAWCLRYFGFAEQPRINGPDLFWKLCAACAERGFPVFLYGGTEETIKLLRARLAEAFPRLSIAGTYSPPFRQLTPQEDQDIVEKINASGTRVVFIALGSPERELWMAKDRGRIKAVMLGVGAAFNFHAGIVKRAPRWMQQSGLEWLYRLLAEPRRLWRRYLVTNSLFIFYLAQQLARKTQD